MVSSVLDLNIANQSRWFACERFARQKEAQEAKVLEMITKLFHAWRMNRQQMFMLVKSA